MSRLFFGLCSKTLTLMTQKSMHNKTFTLYMDYILSNYRPIHKQYKTGGCDIYYILPN